MLPINYVPHIPFSSFKWQWASVQCTEGLNDPVILLGVLSKMNMFDGTSKYSSTEFALELKKLEDDLEDSVNINLSGRGGSRNLIRNSGQYWRAVDLIDSSKGKGVISLTPFGKAVATGDISQSEFAAITIKTLSLPNPKIQTEDQCRLWQTFHLNIHPLMLILDILQELKKTSKECAYITVYELIKIVIPLSSNHATIPEYAQFIQANREGIIDVSSWPNCCPGANDQRMAREFLLFLRYYGYLIDKKESNRLSEKYFLNDTLVDEIDALRSIDNVVTPSAAITNNQIVDIVGEIERKRVMTSRLSRPNQSKFRHNILTSYGGECILTGVKMPEVLEAAHIKPVEYSGNDSIGNGLCLRLDMHQLFDTGHLQISPKGEIKLSSRAFEEYGSVIPRSIDLPDFVNKDYVRWRWDNYRGI